MHSGDAHFDHPSFCAIAARDIAPFVFALPVGRVTLLGNTTPLELRYVLEAFEGEASWSVLCIDLPACESGAALVDAAVGALADAALRMWPLWYGTEDFSGLDGSALSRAALRIRLEGMRRRDCGLSAQWASAAVRRTQAGAPPGRLGTEPAREVAQLSLLLGRPILVVQGAAAPVPTSWVAPMEWLARTAGVPLLVLCRRLPLQAAPFDRWPRRIVATATTGPAGSTAIELGRATWLSSVAGRPHPFSEAEKKLALWLGRDAELAPLFGFNRTVRSREGRCHKVDLLWERGRIVVEIDGYADHATRPKFRDDRHRDYELLMAGYRVLRLTNDEVEDDCGRAVEKIRNVVREHG